MDPKHNGIGVSRTLGAALWALHSCLEHADQSRPLLSITYNSQRGHRDQPFLLPRDLRDWLPQDHHAWFRVDQLDLAPFYRAHRDDGHGHPAHDPKLSLGVLLYGYCLGCAIHQTVVWCCPANTTRIGAGTDRLRTLGLHSRFLARTPSRLVCLRGCASQRAFQE